jgi:hypothetical protein
MLGSQLVVRVKAKLNQLDTTSNRTVRPEMALLFLNDAYLKLTRAKYHHSTGGADDTAFQMTQLTTDELNHLTIPITLPAVLVAGSTDEFEVSISSMPNYWVHLRTKVEILYKGTSRWVSDINYKTLNTTNPATLDPFNKPTPLQPTVYFEAGKIKLPVNGFTVKNIAVTYLRFPETITLTSECTAPFLDEIVDIAAALIGAEWGDPVTPALVALNEAIKAK